MSIRYEIPRNRSRILVTALILGLTGLSIVVLMLFFPLQRPEFPSSLNIVVSWLNMILQPLCLGVVWLTRKTTKNLPLRILVWTYIVVGALFVLFPVVLRFVPGVHGA